MKNETQIQTEIKALRKAMATHLANARQFAKFAKFATARERSNPSTQERVTHWTNRSRIEKANSQIASRLLMVAIRQSRAA